jgi:hypothetical protein
MMSLLFLAYFAAMLLALLDCRVAAITCFGIALLLSLVWLNHHASSTLDILL